METDTDRQADRQIMRQAGSQTSRQTGCMHGKTDKLGKEGLHGDRQADRQTDRTCAWQN